MIFHVYFCLSPEQHGKAKEETAAVEKTKATIGHQDQTNRSDPNIECPLGKKDQVKHPNSKTQKYLCRDPFPITITITITINITITITITIVIIVSYFN